MVHSDVPEGKDFGFSGSSRLFAQSGEIENGDVSGLHGVQGAGCFWGGLGLSAERKYQNSR